MSIPILNILKPHIYLSNFSKIFKRINYVCHKMTFACSNRLLSRSQVIYSLVKMNSTLSVPLYFSVILYFYYYYSKYLFVFLKGEMEISTCHFKKSFSSTLNKFEILQMKKRNKDRRITSIIKPAVINVKGSDGTDFRVLVLLFHPHMIYQLDSVPPS